MQAKTKDCVLVVEDHADTLRLLLRLLEMNGYAAHGATSISEAVIIANREACTLLITDITLPDGSGLELLPTLRRRHDVRGIAVTGHSGPEFLTATRAAGFDAHLTKPITFAKLLTALREIEHEQAASN